ncbi:MAG: hypothetical protein JWQ57_118 [Mucilaginibacter sp.]|nr:hypothetical protein [Mucilaginibacter sp.]
MQKTLFKSNDVILISILPGNVKVSQGLHYLIDQFLTILKITALYLC